jgi:Neutral/alkaline non-lysosomal ceramidase, N-terminal
MSLCGAVQCAALLLGSVQNSRLELPLGVPLGGYGSIHRRDLLSTFLPFKRFSRYFKASVGQDEGGIRSGVLLLRQNQKTIVIVSLETVAVTSQLRSALFINLKQIPGLDLEESGFFLTATHTHSGPGGLSNSMVWELAVMDQFLPEVWDQTLVNVTKSVKSALTKLVPIKLRQGSVRSLGLAKNRMNETIQPANLGHGMLMSNVQSARWNYNLSCSWHRIWPLEFAAKW